MVIFKNVGKLISGFGSSIQLHSSNTHPPSIRISLNIAFNEILALLKERSPTKTNFYFSTLNSCSGLSNWCLLGLVFQATIFLVSYRNFPIGAIGSHLLSLILVMQIQTIPRFYLHFLDYTLSFTLLTWYF